MCVLELLLMIQERWALHEERRERRHPEVDHAIGRIRAATLVRKPFQASSQRVQQGRKDRHPLLESDSLPVANPLCANRVKKSHYAGRLQSPAFTFNWGCPLPIWPLRHHRLTSIHIANCWMFRQPKMVFDIGF